MRCRAMAVAWEEGCAATLRWLRLDQSLAPSQFRSIKKLGTHKATCIINVPFPKISLS